MMIRICVAILLAVVANTQESDVRYSVSENNTRSEDNAVITNPSEYSTEISKTQYGVSSFRNNKPNTESTIPRRHENTRRKKKRILNIKESHENGSVGTFKGYPSFRAMKTNYKAPDELSMKEFHIDASKLKTQKFENYNNDSEIIINNEAIKFQVEPSVIEIPKSYGISKSLDTSIPNTQIKEYGHGEPNGNSYSIPNTFTDSYDISRTRYIDINNDYRTKDSRNQYGIPRSLERSIGVVHNEDFTELENLNKGYFGNFQTYMKLNPKYGSPIINTRTNIGNHEIKFKTNQKYNMPKLDENPPKSLAKFSKTNYSSTVFENPVKDQVFENSNDNFEERFQDYNEDIDDQEYSIEEDDKNESYSREEPFNYDNKASYGTPRLSTSSGDISRSSPGIIGVTQAIIRPNSKLSEPSLSKSSRSHQSYETREDFVRINNGDSYQNRRTVDPESRIAQYGRPPVKSGDELSRTKEHNQFNGYPPGRDNDENENIPTVYRFEYAVSDNGNNKFGHREFRQSRKTRGSYHVILPDGRKQIVDYEADEHGFKPRIRYEKIGYGIGPARHSDRQTGYDVDANY